MQKYCLLCLTLLFLIISVTHPKPAHADTCDLPAEYLSDVNVTFDQYGTVLAEIDLEDPAALASFFIELATVRQSYEERAMDLPVCGLRLHTLLVALLSNMQDTVGIAMAMLADPANTAQYLPSLEDSNTRSQLLVTRIEDEIKILQRPPAISIRYLNVEAANVRLAPNVEAGSLGVIEYGTRIEAISLDLDQYDRPWYEFYFGDQRGWVLGELTTTTPPPPRPEATATSDQEIMPTEDAANENSDG